MVPFEAIQEDRTDPLARNSRMASWKESNDLYGNPKPCC